MTEDNLTARRKMTSTELHCTVGDPQDREITLQGEVQTIDYGTGSIFVAWFAEGLVGTFEYAGAPSGRHLYFAVRRAIQAAYQSDSA